MVSTWLISVTEWYTSQVLFIPPPLWLLCTYVLTSYTVTVLVAVLVVHLLSLFFNYFLFTHFCDFPWSLFVLPLLVDSVGYTCVHVVFLWCVCFKMSCVMNGWMRYAESRYLNTYSPFNPSLPPWERPHCMQVEVFGTWVSSRLILVASSSFSLVCWCGRVETYVSYPCGVKPSDYLLNFIFIKENCCNCRIITRKG